MTSLLVEGIRVELAPGVTEEEARREALRELTAWREARKKLARVRVEVDPKDSEYLLVHSEGPSTIKRLRRITGYVAPVDRWNAGKKAELADRIPHFSLSHRLSRMVRNETTLRVHGLVKESVVDGPGLRSVLFVQGCPHRCSGCQNPDTWDFSGGEEVSVSEVISELKQVCHPLVSGVTLSGGEPLCQAAVLLDIARWVKEKGLNLWVYTGYTWEEIVALADPNVFQLLALTDVLVDGRFVHEQAVPDLPFRGSSNQRLIDVQATLREGRIVSWEPASYAAKVPPVQRIAS